MAMAMASGLRSHTEHCRPGDMLVVVHEFIARSPDELSLKRGDRIELIERDDDFGDGWFLGRNTESGENGLFPEVYTRPAPVPAPSTPSLPLHARTPSAISQHTPVQLPAAPGTATSEPPKTTTTTTTTTAAAAAAQPFSPPKSPPLAQGPTEPLNVFNATSAADMARRTSLNGPPRSISMTLNGEEHPEDVAMGSPVMHETLSVIDEHITDMSTPRHSALVQRDLKASVNNDSSSEYSSHHRLSYINGQETEDEEQSYHDEDEVKTWSPARVADYLEDVGVEKKHCDVFRDQDIDGEALLGVDRNFIFMKEFDLGPMGPRLRTWMKINALQQEVRAAKEAARALTPLDSLDDFAPVQDTTTPRHRASSLGAGMLPRIPTLRESMGSRASSARQNMPRAVSSAARSTSSTIEPTLNHNRRHSSIDYNAPSFDRNWTMGSPQKSSHDLQRPASSNHIHALGSNGAAFDLREAGMNPADDVDRGYFSGGELDNRRNRNVLRKREDPTRSPSSLVSPAAKQYFGGSIKTDRSTALEALSYDTHTIDAIANSPALPGSETSSTGRVSPPPAATTHSSSFFGKKSRTAGLRAISDAITGGERANASASPTRTGSSTPSGTSVSKSFELDKADRRHTSGSTATKDGAKKKASKHGTSAYLKGRQQISPQEAMKNCDYSGWMKKNENDTEEKGLIDISSHRVLPANNERMTAASVDSANAANGIEENMDGMFIFKLVPPRAGLQKGVQFTKPIVHYFAVDSLAVGRLWMAALMKATIDRDEGLPFTTTYQQKTISLDKARAMRQRPPNLMDDEDAETASSQAERRSELGKESLQDSIIHEEDEKQGLAISGLDGAHALLHYAENGSHHTASVNEVQLEHPQDKPLPPIVS
ncbi:hypothetical protein ST47_g8566 [Ascochyta rabiei]|uniref:Uncharacterized protein n=1 Tax=Didymella rabiei TaxID=5454 RepID=A0A162YV32_DIDRA|nr:hypothetical protein ST47_g8566 [Ascochyta rabiei]